MANLHQGVAFSPQTTLSENIGAADTIIKVSDSSVFPDPPNYATIGTDELGETIEYAAKAEGLLSGCTRGVEGTAKAWQKGDVIARNFTAKDHNDMISAVNTAQESANNAQSTANAAKSTAEEALPKSGGTITGPISVPNEWYQFLQTSSITETFAFFQNDESAGLACWPATVNVEKPILLKGIDIPINLNDAANKLYVDRSVIHKNLLDNPYFINPINQRGLSNYNTNGYTIDRWKISNCALTINNDGSITLSNTSSTEARFTQILDYNFINYGLLTLSLFAKNKSGTCSIALQEINGTFHTPIGLVTINEGFNTWTGNSAMKPNIDYQLIIVLGSNSSITLYNAIKLEVGNVQTLAHQQNGEWALNEIPDYATELLKCQRYFIGGRVISTAGVNDAVTVPTPVTMRTLPAVVGDWILEENGKAAVSYMPVPNLLWSNGVNFKLPTSVDAVIYTTNGGLSADL